MFTLSLCDRTMRTLAVIETYESLIWTERYNKEGEFELVTTDVGSWLNIIQNEFLYGNGEGATGTIPYWYWLKKSDTEVVMTIESFRMSSDVEEGNKLTITGRSLEALLDRTVIYDNYIDYTASPYLLIKNIINKYIISREYPTTPRTEFIESSDERITNPPPGWWDEINFDLEGMTVLEAINKICDYSGFGYNMLPREHAGYWDYTQTGQKYWKSDIVYEFRVYLGVDHRDDVIFSPRFDNFANSEFEVSSTDVYTGYYVKLPNLKLLTNEDDTKEGEKAHFVDSDVAQILVENRIDYGVQSYGRMGFIDLSDLDMSDCLEWYKANWGEEWVKNSYPKYTPREQQRMFQEWDNAKIENLIKEGVTVSFDVSGWLYTYAVRVARNTISDNNRVRSAFSGSAEMAASNYVLGVDYSLGDIIRVENEFGISGSSQVVELVQSFNTQDGYTLLPTFTSFTPELDRWLHRNN